MNLSVGNPEDRFCRVEDHMILYKKPITKVLMCRLVRLIKSDEIFIHMDVVFYYD